MDSEKNMEAPPQNRVFVGGISWKANEKQLAEFFSAYGKVIDCKIIIDKATNKSKGYGFVTFESPEDASKVKQYSNLNFQGKLVNVGDAVRKSDLQSQSNGGGGTQSSYSYPGYYDYYTPSSPYYMMPYNPTIVYYNDHGQPYVPPWYYPYGGYPLYPEEYNEDFNEEVGEGSESQNEPAATDSSDKQTASPSSNSSLTQTITE